VGTVLAEMSMSLDGYLTGLDDRVGALHGWYLNGGGDPVRDRRTRVPHLAGERPGPA
jgi:hypothetical protein